MVYSCWKRTFLQAFRLRSADSSIPALSDCQLLRSIWLFHKQISSRGELPSLPNLILPFHLLPSPPQCFQHHKCFPYPTPLRCPHHKPLSHIATPLSKVLVNHHSISDFNHKPSLILSAIIVHPSHYPWATVGALFANTHSPLLGGCT